MVKCIIHISISFSISVFILCLHASMCLRVFVFCYRYNKFLCLKFIVKTYFSNIRCWQQSIDFCRNVSKLQLFTESELKEVLQRLIFTLCFPSPDSLIPLQNGIESVSRKWNAISSFVKLIWKQDCN